jgi:hypothetical protein
MNRTRELEDTPSVVGEAAIVEIIEERPPPSAPVQTGAL